MNEDLIIKIVALFIATFIGIAKLVKYDPLKRWKDDVIQDLEILSKLDKNHSYYKVIKNSADLSLATIYSRDHKPWYSLAYKRNKIFLGTVIIIFFAGITHLLV